METRRLAGDRAAVSGVLLATSWLVVPTVVDVLLPASVVPDTLFAIAPLMGVLTLHRR